MIRRVAQFAFAAAMMLPAAAGAHAITLKLSFFSSDRTVAYQAAVKPFVDAINREGRDVIQIKVYPSSTLGKQQKELPELVLSGEADIAFIIPGQDPALFADTGVIALPGLFRDAREATLVYTRLVAADALSGYGKFFVIGAYGTAPETINSRKKLASLAELVGQKIRVNNAVQAAGLAKLGALPTVLAFNETTPAISSGAIDGATVPAAQLFDVGIGRITNNHFLLPTSVAPLTLMMSRKVFEALPENAKALILKYSGAWPADQFAAVYDKINADALARIESDPHRSVVHPTAAELKTAQAAFASVRKGWASQSDHNRELLARVETEIARLRHGQ